MTTTTNITAATITEKLRDIHAALAGDFRKDSATYALFFADATRQAIALHAGDCLLARRDANGQISWLMQPHTLANALYSVPHAILAKLDARHVLTRSFRSRNFMAPDLTLVDLQDQVLFIGTDGFWADLDPAAQSAFADGRFPAGEAERDDRGLLSIYRAARASMEISGTHATTSIYVRRA
ncbi:hypothetical protein QD460_20485 [Rhizobium jaguaris]|uniref:hypothetical protein n=1 Tax=Rhizobium jaguaris TaxID=1312183 RepID=UPI0039BFAE3F